MLAERGKFFKKSQGGALAGTVLSRRFGWSYLAESKNYRVRVVGRERRSEPPQSMLANPRTASSRVFARATERHRATGGCTELNAIGGLDPDATRAA
jgi:hypothetical protein